MIRSLTLRDDFDWEDYPRVAHTLGTKAEEIVVELKSERSRASLSERLDNG